MFYNIKRKIIEKKLAERNKDKKFDYYKAESYALKKNENPLVNNSYYFSAHDGNLSIYCRLGLRSNQMETWFVIFYQGEKYYYEKELIMHGKSPLWVKRSLNCWVVTFEGELLNSKGDKVNCSFKAAFSSEFKAIDFSTDMLSTRMAVAIAQEKWNKKFFEELAKVQGQTHYEQVGLLEGYFSLGKKDIKFSLPAVRDHSFGVRDWNYMNNHLWLMALAKDEEFNYSMVSYPALSILEVGNFTKNGEDNRLIKEVKYDLKEVSSGVSPQELKLKVTLNNGEILDIKAKVLDTQEYHFQHNDYLLIENIAEFDINGKSFRGILEIGFNKDKKRFFNGKRTGSLKR